MRISHSANILTRTFQVAVFILIVALIGATIVRLSPLAQFSSPTTTPYLSDRNFEFQHRISLPDTEVMACLENFTGLPCRRDILPYVQGPIVLAGAAVNSMFLPRPIRNAIGYTHYCSSSEVSGIISFVEGAARSQRVGSLTAYILPNDLEHCLQMQPLDYKWPEQSVLVISNTGIVGVYDCSEVNVRPSPNCTLDYYFGDGRYTGSTFPIPLRSLGSFIEAFPLVIQRLLQRTRAPLPKDFVVPTFSGTVAITPEAQQFISQSREALK